MTTPLIKQGGDDTAPDPLPDEPKRVLPPEALRALAEAQERRKAQAQSAPPKELGGRNGPEPTRYGDWEVRGIASDF